MFDNALYVSATRGDDLLKAVVLDADETSGNAEAPWGHASLLEITGNMIAQYVSETGDPWIAKRSNFDPGWYIIQTDERGFVYGHHYADEAMARRDFAEHEKNYAGWEACDCGIPAGYHTSDCAIHEEN